MPGIVPLFQRGVGWFRDRRRTKRKVEIFNDLSPRIVLEERATRDFRTQMFLISSTGTWTGRKPRLTSSEIDEEVIREGGKGNGSLGNKKTFVPDRGAVTLRVRDKEAREGGKEGRWSLSSLPSPFAFAQARSALAGCTASRPFHFLKRRRAEQGRDASGPGFKGTWFSLVSLPSINPAFLSPPRPRYFRPLDPTRTLERSAGSTRNDRNERLRSINERSFERRL